MDTFTALVSKSVRQWRELQLGEVEQMIRDYLKDNPFTRIEDVELVCQESVGIENGFYRYTKTYFVREKDSI